MRFEDLSVPVKGVILDFIKPFKRNSNVIGIMLVGSYAYSIPDKNSDIDISIVYNELDYRERGNTWISGFEIEYFINPVKQIYAYLQNEDSLRPHTAHMFANGILLHQKSDNDIIIDIINTAKIVLESGSDLLTETELQLLKYSLDDGLKDLEDMDQQKNYFGYHLLALKLIDSCIQALLKNNRVIQEKYKRLNSQIKILDQKFYDLYNNCIVNFYSYDSMKQIIHYVEELYGGKRSQEWKLRGPLVL